jgi:hypothetical protein
VFQKNVFMEDVLADEKRNVLPVYLLTTQGKRFLLIGLDDGIEADERAVVVETENQVELPEPPPPPPEESEEEDEESEEEDADEE